MSLTGSKISDLNLLPTPTIEDNDLWEVVRSGVNYKIPGSTFKLVMSQYGGGSGGGGIADVPDTTIGGIQYVRRSRIDQAGEWVQVTIPSAYTLPTASASVLGGVKVGSGLTITDGVLGVNVIPDTNGSASASYGMVKVDGHTIISVGGVLTSQGASGTAGVTSIGLALPNIFSVTPPAITTSGTITATFTTQSANTIFAGPASGSAAAPTFRSLVITDLPTMTSTEFAGKISDETGTGSLVFANSPAFSGTPTAPTPTTSDNSTKIATTAFVKSAVTAISLNFETTPSNIKMNGSAFVGALDTVPRADHVHPTDTSRAAKNGNASEAFSASSLTCTSLVLNGHTLTIS